MNERVQKRDVVISPAAMPPGKLSEQLKPFMAAFEIERAVHLAFTSTHFDLSGGERPPAHIFTPLDDTIGRIFVVRQFPVLYRNHFTVSWLLSMLDGLGSGGQLFLEIPSDKANAARGQITVDYLKSLAPKAGIHRPKGSWVQLSWCDGIAESVRRLKTVYTHFHKGFEAYSAAIRSALKGADGFQNTPRYFIYSLSGVNQKSFLWERIVQERMGGGLRSALDLGGGFGFLAGDLAMKGHTVNVIDNNPLHVEMCRWVMRRCGIVANLSAELGDFHDVIHAGIEERYDVVSYFGSLLYAQREQMPDILRASMRMLKAGGVLLIHEGPKESARPDTPDYATRFSAEELDGLLKEHAGEPGYYNVFTAAKSSWEAVQNKVMMAAVAKTQG